MKNEITPHGGFEKVSALDISATVEALKQEVQKLRCELSDAHRERFGMRSQIEVLQERLARVDRQAANKIEHLHERVARADRQAARTDSRVDALARGVLEEEPSGIEELSFIRKGCSDNSAKLWNEAVENQHAADAKFARAEHLVGNWRRLLQGQQAAKRAALGREFAAQRELEIRREINAQLLLTKGRIRLFCRVRGGDSGQHCQENAVQVLGPATLLACAQQFEFHSVLSPQAPQSTVFEEVGPLVDAAFLSSTNACILAYGATGSGKTHTMVGSGSGDDTNSGVIPRTIARLFASPSTENGAPKVGISVAEIYRERVHDLLAAPAGIPFSAGPQGRRSLGRASSWQDRTLSTEYPGSADEALSLCSEAFLRRRTAATAKNDRSSRSHLLVMISIRGGGRLLLADLAGAERQSKGPGAIDSGLVAEACGINKSLVSLEMVIAACVARNRGRNQHIPYRDSPLTSLLRSFVGSDARTLLITHVSPTIDNERETLRALNFASRAGDCVQLSPKSKESILPDSPEVSVGNSTEPDMTDDEIECPLTSRTEASYTSYSSSTHSAGSGCSAVSTSASPTPTPRGSHAPRVHIRRRLVQKWVSANGRWQPTSQLG